MIDGKPMFPDDEPIWGTCSTDLPSEAVGEIATAAIQKAWVSGVDPVADKLSIVLTFG